MAKKKIKPSDLELTPKQVGKFCSRTKNGVETSLEVCDLSRICNETITCDPTAQNCATKEICATKNCEGTNDNCPISAQECNTYMDNCNQTGNKCPDTDANCGSIKCPILTEQIGCSTNICADRTEDLPCLYTEQDNCVATDALLCQETVRACFSNEGCEVPETNACFNTILDKC